MVSVNLVKGGKMSCNSGVEDKKVRASGLLDHSRDSLEIMCQSPGMLMAESADKALSDSEMLKKENLTQPVME